VTTKFTLFLLLFIIALAIAPALYGQQSQQAWLPTVPQAASSFDTPLLKAADTGDTVAVQQLLQNGVNVNAAPNNGITALLVASQEGHADVVKLLLATRANVNAKTNDGRTALMIAKRFGYKNVEELLIRAGAK
jgi:ankyrin repeat protein